MCSCSLLKFTVPVKVEMWPPLRPYTMINPILYYLLTSHCRFDPDRFSEKPSPYTFEPFGVGVRKCPGRDLAYQEALVVLSVILPKVKFTVQEGQVVLPKYGLVTKPNEEIWVTIEKRK